MGSRRQRQAIAGALALALLLPVGLALARTGDSAARSTQSPPVSRVCTDGPGYVVTAIQRYVDQFAGLTGFEDRELPALPDTRAVAREFADVRGDLIANDCSLADFRDGLGPALAGVASDGPMAAAVAATLRGTALRELGAPEPAEVLDVASGDDLAAALGSAAPGSTIRLAPGEHRVDSPLYVLQDVRLVGAGRRSTTILSTSAGASLLVPLDAELRLEDLAVRHQGRRPASVLVLWAGRGRLADVALDGGRLAGRPGDATATAGSGVLLAGRSRLELDRVLVSGNDEAGLLAGGRSRVRATAARLRDNDRCGACFLERAGGRLTGGEVSSNGLGVYVTGRATPVLRDTVLTDNREAAVVVQERARPTLSGLHVLDNHGMGIAVYGASHPVITDSTVQGSGKAGLVLDGQPGSASRATGNRLSGNTVADVVIAGTGRVELTGNACASTVQLVLVGGADPTLSGNSCAVRRQPLT